MAGAGSRHGANRGTRDLHTALAGDPGRVSQHRCASRGRSPGHRRRAGGADSGIGENARRCGSPDAGVMNCDIAIVGGGMVGASLALALAPLGVSIALIEAVPLGSAEQPSFDERTTALSNASRRIRETLGVWPAVADAA